MVLKKIREKLAEYRSRIREGLTYAGCPSTREEIKKGALYVGGGTAGGYLLSKFGDKIAEGAKATVDALYKAGKGAVKGAESLAEPAGTAIKDAATYTITVNPLVLAGTFLGGMATAEGIRLAKKKIKEYKALHPKIEEVAELLGGKQGRKLAEDYHSSLVNALNRLENYTAEIKRLERENKCLEREIKKLYKTKHPEIAEEEAKKLENIINRNERTITSYESSIKELARTVEDRTKKMNEVMRSVYDVINGKSNKLVAYEGLTRRKEIDVNDILKSGEEYLKKRSEEIAEKMAGLALEIGRTEDKRKRKKLQAEYNQLMKESQELSYESMRLGAAERLIGHPQEKRGILNKLRNLRKMLEVGYRGQKRKSSSEPAPAGSAAHP